MAATVVTGALTVVDVVVVDVEVPDADVSLLDSASAPRSRYSSAGKSVPMVSCTAPGATPVDGSAVRPSSSASACPAVSAPCPYSTVVVADNVTLEDLLALGDLRLQDVEPLHGFLSSAAYIAFSPSTPDSVILNWQQALDSMKRDGSFALIYSRWLPGQPIPAELLTPAGR